jgi:hypothetical protein
MSAPKRLPHGATSVCMNAATDMRRTNCSDGCCEHTGREAKHTALMGGGRNTCCATRAVPRRAAPSSPCVEEFVWCGALRMLRAIDALPRVVELGSGHVQCTFD